MNLAATESLRFLAETPWSSARVHTIAGDLSARLYKRLRLQDGRTAILMDASESPAASTIAFVSMTTWLQNLGLSAPRILASDLEQGLLLLEDFGDNKLTKILKGSEVSPEVLSEITSALLTIRKAMAPNLHAPSANELIEATYILDEWYPGVQQRPLNNFRDFLSDKLNAELEANVSVSLRDFHSDNVLWLEDREGAARLGLLDYQDAFMMHPAYDLMSLTNDARVSISPDLAERMLRIYCDQSGDALENMNRAIAVLGAQRNMRILGIFARAASRDGKAQHLNKIPRVRTYLERCLAHPVFASAPDPFAGLPEYSINGQQN